MRRIRHLLTAVIVALTLAGVSALAEQRPNILFCISDDQSWAYTGANGDPSSWQSASTRFLLPTGTEFVMMKMSFRRMPKGSEVPSSLPDPVIFAGHFVDDVRASVTIRKAVPNQRNATLP